MITNRRKTLGVFMNKADLNFQNTVQRITQQRAREMGYDVFYFFTVGYRESSNFYDGQELRMFDFTPMEKLDGALVTPDTYDMPGFREALFDMFDKRARCPIVCVRDSASAYSSFYTDESYAIRPMLAHLLDDHGFRKVCFLAGYVEHPDSNARLACYKEEMARRGLPLPPNAVHHGSMWSRGSDKAYQYFFGDPDNWPEAVVCANDYMAQALIEEVQLHGHSVPGDVVITGFDDVDTAAHFGPALTTVGQDYETMVNGAMDLLHERIQAGGGRDKDARYMGLPGALEIRESCGCKADNNAEGLRREICQVERSYRALMQREVSQTYFAIELNSAESYEAMHKTICRKMEDVPNVRDFYLCLFEDENGYADAITPRARLISAYRDRQDAGMPMVSFDRQEILPAMAERADEPQAFYIHLLHQGHKTYGYTVMQFAQGTTPSIFYTHWNIIVSIALRNLDNQFKLQGLYEERRRSSITDALTGLNNRRGVDEALLPHWEEWCAQHKTVCFLSMDLDNLKPINDTFGHQGGDKALRLIAQAICAAMPEGAVAARIGGDEYLVFIPDCDEAGVACFRKLLDAFLAEKNREEGSRFSVGASVGARVITLQEGVTVSQCVHESDEAMYTEKKRRHAELRKHARTLQY